MVLPSQIDLNNALLAHQAGHLEEAEALYRNLIREMPENVDIWHLLGALYHQKGDLGEAKQFLDRALALNPQFPEALNTRGILLKEQGQLIEAERDFRAALIEIAEFPQALTNLADVLRLKGDLGLALEFAERALKLAPDLAAAFNNLGAIERDLSNLEAATLAFQKALDLDPDLIDAAINLALTLNVRGKSEKAIERAEKTAEIALDYAAAQNCLGTIYFDNAKNEAAQECFEQALLLEPHYSEAHNNLANTLTRLNDLEAALVHFDLALKLEPKNADFWANKAAALQAKNDIDGALAACETALKLNPQHVDALWNRAIARLIAGDLVAGFTDYETRWSLPEFSRPDFGAPLWEGGNLGEGGNLAGKSLLLHSEQGYGDTLQFIRYVTLISAQEPKAIYLQTHEPLRKLLEPLPAITKTLLPGETVPEIDFQCSIMALPHIFGTTLETIPQKTPYLSPPTKPSFEFPINSEDATKTKIGLVWAGRPTHKNDRNRSIEFKMLKPLFEQTYAHFYGLQLGEAQKDLGSSSELIDLSPHLTDFAATAAIFTQLDLIITVDTAVAHLAGALDKKCWVMLPFAPDWRWLLDRDDSPWYPSLTLFRQTKSGDWANVIMQIGQKLAQMGA